MDSKQALSDDLPLSAQSDRANYHFVLNEAHHFQTCKECGRTGDALIPTRYRSSDASWAALAGRAGYRMQCPEHPTRLGLGFILTSFN